MPGSDPERRPAVMARRAHKVFYVLGPGDTLRLLTMRRPTEVFQALSEISFEVPQGEFFGVLGRNGAGKSTLLRLLGGAYSPTRGQVYADGPTSAIYELGVGGNDRLTGREFAIRWFSLYGTGGAKLEDVLDEVVQFSELGEYFDRPIFTYSSGMAGRLYFAVATVLPGQIYLIDEVLAVGDEYFQHKSWRRMRSRLAEGASGVLATHDFTAVLKLCDKALILDGGRITAQGAAPAIVRRYLELEPPTGGASFIGLDDRSVPFAVQTGQDLAIELVVESDVDLPLLIGVSIETFQRGIGWEHLLQLDPTVIGSGKGRHRIELLVPRIPLNAGEYSLNLFLVAQPDPAVFSYNVLDARSWSHGSGLTVLVTGPERDGLFRLPVCWSHAEAAAV